MRASVIADGGVDPPVARPAKAEIGHLADIVAIKAAGVLADAFDLVITERHRGMAAPAREVHTIGTGQIGAEIVTLLADARSGREFQPLNVVPQDHVDRARDRFRTIDRCTPDRHAVHPLDQDRGDHVEIDLRARIGVAEDGWHVGTDGAAAVDQRQRPVRGEAERIDEIDAPAMAFLHPVGRVGIAKSGDLVQRIGDVGEIARPQIDVIDTDRRLQSGVSRKRDP